MKHFIDTRLLSLDDIEVLLELASRLQVQHSTGHNATTMCSGKVLGTLFFQPSVRTQTTVQSAIIRLGGGHTGISGVQGTFLENGDEDLNDFIDAYAQIVDLMVVRHRDIDLASLSARSPIPIINGGTAEHTLAGLGYLYTLMKYKQGLSNIKSVGFVGLNATFRDYLAAIRLFSKLDIDILIDPKKDVLGEQQELYTALDEEGVEYTLAPCHSFTCDVDGLFVTMGLNASATNILAFDGNDLAMLGSQCGLFYSMPRKVYEEAGSWIIASDGLADLPQVLSKPLIQDLTFCAMAVMNVLIKESSI